MYTKELDSSIFKVNMFFFIVFFTIGQLMEGLFQFAIDRGGTFTDVWAQCPSGKVRVTKLLSEDPLNYQDAPREGIRRILEQVISHVTSGC